MDHYGCMRHSPEDAAEVALALHDHGTVVFPYSFDQIGCMVIFVSIAFEKLGVMPYGGNPEGRAYMGVYGRGCAHISLQKQIEYQSYLDEKLNLGAVEAEHLAEFWGWVCDSLAEY